MPSTAAQFALVLALLTTIAPCAADDASKSPAATPAVGSALPAIESTDEAGQPWKSTDHVGKNVLVIYLYPGDFTGGCIVQAEAYRNGLARIESLGAEVVGISGDEAAAHKLFKETYGLKHTLLSDSKGDAARALGVPVSGGSRVVARDRDRKSILDAEGKPVVFQRPVTLARWTFVIDRQGNIASLRNTVDPAKDIDEVHKIVSGLTN